jgi:hypothetical protein
MKIMFFKVKYWPGRFSRTVTGSPVHPVLTGSARFKTIFSRFCGLPVFGFRPDRCCDRFPVQPVEPDGPVRFLQHWPQANWTLSLARYRIKINVHGFWWSRHRKYLLTFFRSSVMNVDLELFGKSEYGNVCALAWFVFVATIAWSERLDWVVRQVLSWIYITFLFLYCMV